MAITRITMQYVSYLAFSSKQAPQIPFDIKQLPLLRAMAFKGLERLSMMDNSVQDHAICGLP